MRLAASDNDPYCPEGATALYAERHGVDCDIVQGAGHLDVDAGSGPWPSVLQWCLDVDAHRPALTGPRHLAGFVRAAVKTARLRAHPLLSCWLVGREPALLVGVPL